MIDQKRVKGLFKYDNGDLIRITNVAPNARKGSIVGRVDSHGYMQVAIDKKDYFNHSLIWLYHYGYMPKEIDHINRIKTDNRIENLREVSRTENMQNLGFRKNSKSGVPGVSWNKAKQKWEAYISVNRKLTYLGAFKEFYEAVCHRCAAEQCLGFFVYKSKADEYVKNNIINK